MKYNLINNKLKSKIKFIRINSTKRFTNNYIVRTVQPSKTFYYIKRSRYLSNIKQKMKSKKRS